MNSGTKLILTIVTSLFVISCGGTKKSTAKCYRKTKTILVGYGMGKMIDSYFKLKKGNYFQYYEKLAGLIKMDEYNGSYTQKNDSLFLTFCGGNIPEGLTRTAFIDTPNKQIILFGKSPELDQHFGIRYK